MTSWYACAAQELSWFPRTRQCRCSWSPESGRVRSSHWIRDSRPPPMVSPASSSPQASTLACWSPDSSNANWLPCTCRTAVNVPRLTSFTIAT